MRLINCQVKNVRIHSDISIDLSPQITLIEGANETGKSTLIEALHRTLFLKATATGAPIQALRSNLHLGHPTIQIRFEEKGEIYLLRKCFTGSSGQITLSNESNKSQLSGPPAEEYLAELLGVNESLGSRQASKLLPTRWAHLWVMQGSSGNDLLNSDKTSYDFDSLLIQLEKTGGAAIQVSAHDQSVIKKIDMSIEKNFTSRGIKKSSSFWQSHEELKGAELELETAHIKLKQYEESSEDLVKINERIDLLQNIQLPALLEEERLIKKRSAERNQLEAEVTLATKVLEAIQLRYDASKKSFKNLNQIQLKIKQQEGEQRSLTKLQGEQGATKLCMTNSLKREQVVHTNLKSKLQQLDQYLSLLQTMLDQSYLKETISRLSNELEKIKKIIDKRNKLEEQITYLSKIDLSDLEQLRDLNQKILNALARQESMATGITVLQSNKSIRIDGEELQTGEQKQLVQTFELQVGDNITIEIRPGGSETLKTLQLEYKSLKKEYFKILSRFGLESLKVAENDFKERLSLEQQLSFLEVPSNSQIQLKQKELSKNELKKFELEKKLSELDQLRNDFLNDLSVPSTTFELETLKEKTQKNRSDVSSAFEQAEKSMKLAESEFYIFRDTLIDNESKLKVIDNQLTSLRNDINALIKEHGDHESLNAEINLIGKELKESEEKVVLLRNRLSSLEKIDRSNDLPTIELKIHSIEETKEKLIADAGAAKKNCDNISASDPYSNLEQAEVRLRTVQADYLAQKRIIDSHKLLQELFRNAQADLSSRYTEPLIRSINNYLKPIIPDGHGAHLNFDHVSGFNGLQIRRGDDFYDFNQLSGGMREQLSAALRLSMADVLKSEHDGCLPLIFDDAFANSDPTRIPLIKSMLSKAVKRGLQVILLTCDPKSYESFANTLIKLDKLTR